MPLLDHVTPCWLISWNSPMPLGHNFLGRAVGISKKLASKGSRGLKGVLKKSHPSPIPSDGTTSNNENRKEF